MGAKAGLQELRGEIHGLIAPLYSFISARMGNERSSAEDITQETLVAALEGRFDPDRGDLKAWLISIALRKIVDVQRRRGTSRDHARGVAHELATRMIREPLPADLVERRETREVVNEALSKLPAVDAWLLARKYFGSAGVTEIAGELELSEKAVESRLTRARSAFHEIIQSMAARPEELEP